MNVEDLLRHAEGTLRKAHNLMEDKNHDYAGAEGVDPFRNFKLCEEQGLCSTEIGILVRMTDKMSRLATFLQNEEFRVKDETFDDTVIDLINYAVILSAYRRQQGDAQDHGA